jgi:hypothetical protein
MQLIYIVDLTLENSSAGLQEVPISRFISFFRA